MNEINLFDLVGLIDTVTTVPSKPATNIKQQIVLYFDNLTTPTVKRLYIYSNKRRAWHYITLTA